ncbi:16946_t:CDS:1, partial [Funneliformis caledonium]
MKSIFLVLGLFATLALASYQDKDKHYDYHDKNVKSYDPYYNPWVPAKYYDHKDYYDEKEKHYRRSKRSPVPTDD